MASSSTFRHSSTFYRRIQRERENQKLLSDVKVLKKEEVKPQLENINKAKSDNPNFSSDHSSVYLPEDDTQTNWFSNQPSFEDGLRTWALGNKVTHKCLDELLLLLNANRFHSYTK